MEGTITTTLPLTITTRGRRLAMRHTFAMNA